MGVQSKHCARSRNVRSYCSTLRKFESFVFLITLPSQLDYSCVLRTCITLSRSSCVLFCVSEHPKNSHALQLYHLKNSNKFATLSLLCPPRPLSSPSLNTLSVASLFIDSQCTRILPPATPQHCDGGGRSGRRGRDPLP